MQAQAALRSIKTLNKTIISQLMFAFAVRNSFISMESLCYRNYRPSFFRKQAQNACFQWLNTSVLGLFSRKRGSINFKNSKTTRYAYLGLQLSVYIKNSSILGWPSPFKLIFTVFSVAVGGLYHRQNLSSSVEVITEHILYTNCPTTTGEKKPSTVAVPTPPCCLRPASIAARAG
jgi:hypothetical protein